MPVILADGIPTRYETTGDGPPLLLFSPGGFDARLENWSELSGYAALELLPALAERYTCISFDRRESGQSGGRVQRLCWTDYVAQAIDLLDQLGIAAAHLMGGCVGCSSVVATAVAAPSRVLSMVLYSPAGGPRYRMKQHARFATHAAFVEDHGLVAVVARARSHVKGFTQDPPVGPWAGVIRNDPDFADHYAALDPARYLAALTGTVRALYDRDTVPGAEPEDLMLLDQPALIVPGEDDSHAPSAARYLRECLTRAEYWDVPVAQRSAANAPSRVLEFLDAAG
jgi:pimeloyl-ACP methyl ester carboxylesterase